MTPTDPETPQTAAGRAQHAAYHMTTDFTTECADPEVCGSRLFVLAIEREAAAAHSCANHDETLDEAYRKGVKDGRPVRDAEVRALREAAQALMDAQLLGSPDNGHCRTCHGYWTAHRPDCPYVRLAAILSDTPETDDGTRDGDIIGGIGSGSGLL